MPTIEEVYYNALLERNKDKRFIQRILQGDNVELETQQEGNRFNTYPKEYEYEIAQKLNNMIIFNNRKEAEWFNVR